MTRGGKVKDGEPPMGESEFKTLTPVLLDFGKTQPLVCVCPGAWDDSGRPATGEQEAFVVGSSMPKNRSRALYGIEIHRSAVKAPNAKESAQSGSPEERSLHLAAALCHT
jgi:hypothetical protein